MPTCAHCPSPVHGTAYAPYCSRACYDAAWPTFTCAVCSTVRLAPAAVEVGSGAPIAPVCGPCARRLAPDALTGTLDDGTDEEFRDCCGGCTGDRCLCQTGTAEGFDRDTGPWDEVVCFTHHGQA